MGSRLEIADAPSAFRRLHLFLCLFVCFLFYALIHGKKFYPRVFNLQDMDGKERFCKAFTGEKKTTFQRRMPPLSNANEQRLEMV